MKKILFALSFIACAFSVHAQDTRESLAIGAHMPLADAKLKATTGKMTTLEHNVGKNGLLVMFSCNTCPFVIKSQQRTKQMMAYAKAHGIGMVIVNSNQAQRNDADSYKAMVSYAKKQKYTVPYVVDENSRLANDFGASRTPEVYLFNKKGDLVYKGAMEDNPAEPATSKEMYLKTAMNNMIAGAAINPNSTKSVGCGIKRMER